MTNGDKIRQMSDEELALKFAAACPDDYDVTSKCRLYYENGGGCKACWLEWIKQEVEE